MNREEALQLDRQDPLAHVRHYFKLPANTIYLCGHSLGAMPISTSQHLSDVMQAEWGELAIQAWNKADWISMPLRLGSKIAGLIGAKAHEVVVADSTSVNLYKLLISALRLRPTRHVILTDEANFPADLYIADGAIKSQTSYRVVRCKRDEIAQHLNHDVALVMLTHVNYRSGEMYDMQAITSLAHQQGALVLFDLAHSAGIVPLDVNQLGIDFAVGCGYKYLNGGPGAPAFLYVADQHLASVCSPLTGWMGHQAPFAFSHHYIPAQDARKFLCGTPPILAMSALEHSIDMLKNISIHAIREKNNHLANLMMQRMASLCPSMQCISPTNPTERGGHLGFFHPESYAINRALLDHGVMADYRAPHLIRFGLSPLYLRYVDIFDAVEVVAKIINEKIFMDSRYQINVTVT